MPKHLSILLSGLLLLVITVPAFSQKESNNWYFGINAGIDFNTTPPTVLSNGQIATREGVCAMSDKNSGQLLFYSEGTQVLNRNHAVMPNGNGLLGDYSSTQSSIAIPNPGNPNKYFLFTTATFKGTRYSEVDMTLSGGNGDVIAATKNTLLIIDNESSEKLIAVKHCNGRDYWVVSHKLNSNAYVVILVNAGGVQAPVIQNIGAVLGDAINWTGTGYLKFSADGSKLVNCIGPAASGLLSNAELFNFDNKTGILSGPVVQLTGLNSPYGAEFSLKKKFLYISELIGQKINQYDLAAADINGSRTTVASSLNLLFGALQMGPDGKIYASSENGFNISHPSLGVINFPELPGPACNFIQSGIILIPGNVLIGLPTFPANFLLKDTALISYTSACRNEAATFSFSGVSNVDSVKWNFGDASPVSTLLSPTHTYTTLTTYSVQLILYKSCSSNDTIIKPVTISNCAPASTGFSLPDTVCVNAPVTITNNSVSATTSYWNFCSGSLNTAPVGTNLTSPNLSQPVFMDLVQEGTNFYVFVVNHTGSLVRMNFGNSLLNTPTTTNLGSFGGIIPPQAEGLDIQQDGTNWIGYLIGGQGGNSRLVKLFFGTSLANTPVATNLGNIGGLLFPVDFTLIKEAANWYGFTVNADNNTVTRYSFGTSLNNTPTTANLGNVGGFNSFPEGFFLLKDGINYHMFITNRNNNRLVRLDFGNSVTNTPTATNLGNPGNNFNMPRDITLIRDCGNLIGFVTNEGGSTITKLDFDNNILSVPTSTSIGNIGTLNYPHSISEIFRTGDAVNFFIPNVNSNTVSRLSFNNCTNSTIPSYTGVTPPVYQYTQPGTYSVSLFVDDGLPTQAVLCKQIVVKDCTPPPPVTIGFEIPDTVCVNTPITITNTSANAVSAYWNFCVANINSTPAGTNLGNIGGQLFSPVFIDYVQYNGNYYGFVTNNSPGKLTRLDFGNSLLNTPTAVNLGNVGGTLPVLSEGIQLVFSQGRWYAIITGDNASGSGRIVKVDFGPNLTNTTPTGTNWGNIGALNYAGDLHLFNDNGNWYAFTADADHHVIRFSFGTDFLNPPTAVNFGNVGNTINTPTGIYAITDNGQWYVFVTNRDNSTITRLDFGNSLLNAPTAVALGNPNNTLNQPRDIYIMKFCGELVGFVVNQATNDLVKLNFTSLTAIPTAVSMGNIGNFSFPHSISKIFRVGSDLYSFIPNVSNNTLTRLKFSGCTNSSIPNYAGDTPPDITYTAPGTYNINLTINDGLPTQATICKQIVVKDCGKQISGVINDYTEVVAFDPCKNTLTVANSAAYNVGDTVLMIQMQGAVVDSTNTAAFGSVTDYKNAGNYEFNYVKSKNGNIIELKNFMVRQYDIPDGKVQLIRVPYYTDANITSPVTCLPWDGGKGGVVVLNVQNTLTSTGSSGVDVSYKGFRGGIDPFSNPSQANCYENQYYYPPNPDLASGKGEGIAILSAGKSFGKGSVANGGGGGNSHNSGGGGGSNGSGGGFGGYNYELTPCNTIVPFDNRGVGGHTLTYSGAVNKIFMGGGGGAGHTNNPEGFQALGGNGGGIAIISANKYAPNIAGGNLGALAIGMTAPGCQGLGATGCHEGMGGGGAGGTLILDINSYQGVPIFHTKGGQGANIDVAGLGRLGPGGGASGGVTWYKVASFADLPPNIAIPSSGGTNGVNSAYTNDEWGATGGEAGLQLFNLPAIPRATIPFKPNIDSVRIKDSITNCKSFDFKGFGYTNTSPVASWQWQFGDGGTAATQNTSHDYTNDGSYTVKLIVTDINGCKDSITKQITTTVLNLDFNYQLNPCAPLTVLFNGLGIATQNPQWTFGDNTTATGTLSAVHTYASHNTYTVQYSASDGVCIDTITKTISLIITAADIIFTPDTTICAGTTKQLRALPALSHCWTPITNLSDPTVPTPVTSTPVPITYYYTALVSGSNLISNGDFSQGNTGFSSAYNFVSPNTTEGQYFVGTNPQAWNASLSACTGHTVGNGNMMLVNGSPTDNVKIWSQTITVQPNTSYAFSAWIQSLGSLNPATLQFSINGINMPPLLQAGGTPCVWQQYYTIWNSGNITSATIAIVNKNLLTAGNDFAIDDISFAPVFMQRDSVKITLDTAVIKTNDDAIICQGKNIQLTTTGGVSYTWTPSATLSNSGISNPVATPVISTQYVVTGTNANGCSAKDTVNITVNPKPAITKSADKEICKNTSVQIFATGGGTYAWTPTVTLDNPSLSNPTASPLVSTRYYVIVTGANTCTNTDSVDISIRPDPVFTISAGGSVCDKDSIQLTAAGGTIYSWQPAASLSNASIANPRAAPATATNYSVTITEPICNISKVLQTNVNVNPLPLVKVTKANDLDCSNDQSQLNATGAASYAWTPALSLNNPNIANPVASPTGNTKYTVKGTDAQGCINYDTVTVFFLSVNASGYFMPNAFTPNNDGLNDCYGIRYWGVIRELEFSIYNRWGERIFFTKDPGTCWDGVYKGKAQDIGVYVYVIKAKTLCGDTFKKGLFTLAK